MIFALSLLMGLSVPHGLLAQETRLVGTDAFMDFFMQGESDEGIVVDIPSIPVMAVASGLTRTEQGVLQLENLIIHPRTNGQKRGRIEADGISFSSARGILNLLSSISPDAAGSACRKERPSTTAWWASHLRFVADGDSLLGGGAEAVHLREVGGTISLATVETGCRIEAFLEAEDSVVDARTEGVLSTGAISATYEFRNGRIVESAIRLEGLAFDDHADRRVLSIARLVFEVTPERVEAGGATLSHAKEAFSDEPFAFLNKAAGAMSLQITGAFFDIVALLGPELRARYRLQDQYLLDLETHVRRQGQHLDIQIATSVDSALSVALSTRLLNIPGRDQGPANPLSLTINETIPSFLSAVWIETLEVDVENDDAQRFFVSHTGQPISQFFNNSLAGFLVSLPRPVQYVLGRSISRLSSVLEEFVEANGSLALSTDEPIPALDLVRGLLTLTPPAGTQVTLVPSSLR